MTSTAHNPWERAPEGIAAALAAALVGQLPVLTTARLTLRAATLADFEPYATILMSERAAFMNGPFDREAAWLDFCQYCAGWQLRGAGLFTITRREDGETLGFGTIGMEYGDREHELGYFLLPEADNHGYATEAATALRDFALGPHGLPSLVSYIDPDNAASARIAAKIGALRDHAAEKTFDEPVHVYRHLPTDNDGSPEAYA